MSYGLSRISVVATLSILIVIAGGPIALAQSPYDAPEWAQPNDYGYELNEPDQSSSWRDAPSLWDGPEITRESNSTDTPSWGRSSWEEGHYSFGDRNDGVIQNLDGFEPNDPDPIPVNGGLGLLLVAGAGYAAHRLRKKEDDTDADDAPLP